MIDQRVSTEETLENVIRFLLPRFPDARELIKPTAFHSIRVGTYLYENGYSDTICIAGFLHDVLEDTDITESEIEKNYGRDVADIVVTNTKNMNLDRAERKIDLANRCLQSENALIVKCADIMDNFRYRTRQGNTEELESLKTFARMIKKDIPSTFTDKIFTNFFTLLLG